MKGLIPDLILGQGKKSNIFQKRPLLEQWTRAGGLGNGSTDKCLSHRHEDNWNSDSQNPHKAGQLWILACNAGYLDQVGVSCLLLKGLCGGSEDNQ